MRKIGWILIFAIVAFGVFTMQASAMLDPSAVYCEELGYEYYVISTDKGDKGICKLSDDTFVDAWLFLKGDVALDRSYCAEQGYEVKSVEDSETSKSYTTCLLPDGSEASVVELMDLSFDPSECGDDFCGLPENHNTCPEDCPSGGSDEYCDGIADGKCDPDCEISQESDPDCEVEELAKESINPAVKEATGSEPTFDTKLLLIPVMGLLLALGIIAFIKKK